MLISIYILLAGLLASPATITTTTTNTTTNSTLTGSALVTSTSRPTTVFSSATATAATTTTTTTTTASTDRAAQVASSPMSNLIAEAQNQATQSIEEVKRIIQQHIDLTPKRSRLAVNRPVSMPQVVDFAPDSIEARVSEATTQFGLGFMNSLPLSSKENVILSPLSLQNLLNMILLGCDDNSATQQELASVLGYEATGLLTGANKKSGSGGSADALRPHEAMRNVFQSILASTHMSAPVSADPGLLNTNPGSLSQADSTSGAPGNSIELTGAVPAAQKPAMVAANLQTSVRDGDTPLSGQVNFTLANLVLINKMLVELRAEYESNLKAYYNVNVEEFSRAGTPSEVAGELPLQERVNNWVKNKTANQIEKLASASDLDDQDLAMVLLNAAHFKGRWLHTFNPRGTHDGTFFNAGDQNQAARVKFMRQKAVFGYADFGTAAVQNELMSASESKTRPSEDAETLLTEDDSAPLKGQPADKSPASEWPSSAAPTNGSSTGAAPESGAPLIELSKEEARRMELTSRLNCSVLMLPFSLNDGQELSMVLLLPAKRDGLPELQAALTAQSLNEIYRSISEQQVQVEIPKFAFEASHDAKPVLLKMGLSSVFGQSAKLGKMFLPARDAATAAAAAAKVDKVIHKAKIQVDESGAEAAAASMASIVLRNFIRPPTPVFVADHPFLFVIRHNRSNMPLFMGRVSSF